MKADYARLLEAAKKLRQWESASEVANGLTKAGYPVSEQMMSNWKSRGLSKDCKLRSAAIIGFRIPWLENRAGSMTENEPLPANGALLVRENTKNVSYFPEKTPTHPAIEEVLRLMIDTDELGRGMILAKVRDIAEERKILSSKPKLST